VSLKNDQKKEDPDAVDINGKNLSLTKLNNEVDDNLNGPSSETFDLNNRESTSGEQNDFISKDKLKLLSKTCNRKFIQYLN
jgi:hypothetical protein